MMPSMDEKKIETELAKRKDWSRLGDSISRTFEFTDFPASIRFVVAIAKQAEKSQHHPDIMIRWNKVTLTLSTHDAGGITEKDFASAKYADEVAAKTKK